MSFVVAMVNELMSECLTKKIIKEANFPNIFSDSSQIMVGINDV